MIAKRSDTPEWFIMNAAFQSICYNISRTTSLKRSHIHEVIAALLGYASHAAMVEDDKNPQREYSLADAEYIILNVPQGMERAQKFNVSDEGFGVFISELKSGLPMKVSESVDDFYDDHIREILEEAIYQDAAESGEMAESNADFPDYPDMDYDLVTSGNLWTSVDEWSIADTGTLSGEYDPEGDRMYNGHLLNVQGKLTFAKAGRAGLILLDDITECSTSRDYSWLDDEPLDIED